MRLAVHHIIKTHTDFYLHKKRHHISQLMSLWHKYSQAKMAPGKMVLQGAILMNNSYKCISMWESTCGDQTSVGPVGLESLFLPRRCRIFLLDDSLLTSSHCVPTHIFTPVQGNTTLLLVVNIGLGCLSSTIFKQKCHVKADYNSLGGGSHYVDHIWPVITKSVLLDHMLFKKQERQTERNKLINFKKMHVSPIFCHFFNRAFDVKLEYMIDLNIESTASLHHIKWFFLYD